MAEQAANGTDVYRCPKGWAIPTDPDDPEISYAANSTCAYKCATINPTAYPYVSIFIIITTSITGLTLLSVIYANKQDERYLMMFYLFYFFMFALSTCLPIITGLSGVDMFCRDDVVLITDRDGLTWCGVQTYLGVVSITGGVLSWMAWLYYVKQKIQSTSGTKPSKQILYLVDLLAPAMLWLVPVAGYGPTWVTFPRCTVNFHKPVVVYTMLVFALCGIVCWIVSAEFFCRVGYTMCAYYGKQSHSAASDPPSVRRSISCNRDQSHPPLPIDIDDVDRHGKREGDDADEGSARRCEEQAEREQQTAREERSRFVRKGFSRAFGLVLPFIVTTTIAMPALVIAINGINEERRYNQWETCVFDNYDGESDDSYDICVKPRGRSKDVLAPFFLAMGALNCLMFYKDIYVSLDALFGKLGLNYVCVSFMLYITPVEPQPDGGGEGAGHGMQADFAAAGSERTGEQHPKGMGRRVAPADWSSGRGLEGFDVGPDGLEDIASPHGPGSMARGIGSTGGFGAADSAKWRSGQAKKQHSLRRVAPLPLRGGLFEGGERSAEDVESAMASQFKRFVTRHDRRRTETGTGIEMQEERNGDSISDSISLDMRHSHRVGANASEDVEGEKIGDLCSDETTTVQLVSMAEFHAFWKEIDRREKAEISGERAQVTRGFNDVEQDADEKDDFDR